MKTETEAKFLNVDSDAVRAKLRAAGAECAQPMRLMKRAVAENEALKAQGGFVRVRDEGDKVTLTYKQFNTLSVDGAKEVELVVDDFDEAVRFLAQVGLAPRSVQESKRETWRLGDVEIMLDEWPWLKPYIEVEGPGEQQVQEVAEQLGFAWDDAAFGDVMAAYRAEYPHLTPHDTVGHIAEVRFGDPLPDLLKTGRV